MYHDERGSFEDGHAVVLTLPDAPLARQPRAKGRNLRRYCSGDGIFRFSLAAEGVPYVLLVNKQIRAPAVPLPAPQRLSIAASPAVTAGSFDGRNLPATE
jgi:hypothetical protein